MIGRIILKIASLLEMENFTVQWKVALLLIPGIIVSGTEEKIPDDSAFFNREFRFEKLCATK